MILLNFRVPFSSPRNQLWYHLQTFGVTASFESFHLFGMQPGLRYRLKRNLKEKNSIIKTAECKKKTTPLFLSSSLGYYRLFLTPYFPVNILRLELYQYWEFQVGRSLPSLFLGQEDNEPLLSISFWADTHPIWYAFTWEIRNSSETFMKTPLWQQTVLPVLGDRSYMRKLENLTKVSANLCLKKKRTIIFIYNITRLTLAFYIFT